MLNALPETPFEAPLIEMIGQQKITVIGCGNRWAGDDAAGIAVVETLGKVAPEELSLRLMDDLGPGFLWEVGNEGIVILVDAVKSGAIIGTIHFSPLRSASVVSRGQRLSTHSLGLDREIELASSYCECLKVFLLGLEIGDHRLGTGLSSIVSTAVDKVVANFAHFCACARSQSDPSQLVFGARGEI